MRYFFIRTALVVAALAASVGMCSVPPRATVVNSESASAVLLTFADGTCSGTVVAPRTILTAAHCLDNAVTQVRIDGTLVDIWRREVDGRDHVLLYSSHVFQTYTKLGASLNPGDRVHVFGNPGSLRHVYREGLASGVFPIAGAMATLLQLPTFFGDSGAGVFDAYGHVVTSITGIYIMADKGYTFQVAYAYPMNFTGKQLKDMEVE